MHPFRTVRVDKEIKSVVVHWDIAFGGFFTLDIGFWSAPYIVYCSLRKCQYTASWVKTLNTKVLPLPVKTLYATILGYF